MSEADEYLKAIPPALLGPGFYVENPAENLIGATPSETSSPPYTPATSPVFRREPSSSISGMKSKEVSEFWRSSSNLGL